MYDITKTTTFIATSNIATVTTTRDLIVGLYLYSSNLIPCTKIVTIAGDGITLTLSSNAIANGSFSVVYTDMNAWMYQSRCEMLKEIQDNVNQIGNMITLYLRDETDISRDGYNSIKQRLLQNKYSFKVYPVIYSPAKEILEKVGLKQLDDCIIYIPMKTLNDNSITVDLIEPTRSSVILDGGTYQVTEKSGYSEFGDIQQYCVLGLTKK